EFFRRLSPASLYSRFFDMRTPEAAVACAPADVDYRHTFGMVGELNGEIVAIAHYFASKTRPDVAEVAFAISDDLQGCGMGTRLLDRLADVARTQGIDRFEAETLTENRPMLSVFLDSGFDVVSHSSAGIVGLSFPISATAKYEERSAERSQKAAYASMRPVFAPKSIAVVGASRRPGHLGGEVLRHLRMTGFQGSLYAVNPSAKQIGSVPSYPTVRDIPEPVELAVIAVPAADVEKVIDDCIDKGVLAAVVISAGFGETGVEGRTAEHRLVEKVRASGMRMVGPNCMGVLNTDPDVHMHATFASLFPPAGNVAMSSQSGALGLAILDYAKSLHIGFSTFISVGNKADVSGNDLIQYWAEDPKTNVILLYLESFGNPKKFAQIARRVGKEKPIVVVKAGRSQSGARAASSHTGAMATDDAVVDDLLRQAGVIRTDTLEELFDVATLLSNQPLPPGPRVAIVTNAGGPGILAADACEANGLKLAPLSETTTNRLRSFLPAAASVANPVDMIASATPDQYAKTLEAVLSDPNVDAVIAIYIPVIPTDAPAIAATIRESATKACGRTVVATFMSVQGVPASLAPVPAFSFPERAATALARAAKYAEWRSRPLGNVVEIPDIDEPALRGIVDARIAKGGGWLEPIEVRDLFRAAHISAPELQLANDREDAVDAAICMEFPVALKAFGPALLHKSDIGGVKLGLDNVDAVRSTYDDMKQRIGDAMTGVVVQKMAPRGVEVMVGATADPMFGHIVAYGAGGTLVELLADVAFRILPLTDVDIDDMISQSRVSKLLAGVRGSLPADVPALKDIISRVAALLGVCPEIRELDINPVMVLGKGVSAVDARIRVEAIVPGPPSRRVAY
ncbi:MAG: bifunctional acetate--CoA ligase family protein/GNAT family N-acetyltransferase, partial [Thermoanaerobaculia bacterium]